MSYFLHVVEIKTIISIIFFETVSQRYLNWHYKTALIILKRHKDSFGLAYVMFHEIYVLKDNSHAMQKQFDRKDYR